MENRNTVIQLTDTLMDIMLKMSKGNPGAINVLMELYTTGGKIDPDSALEGLGSIFALDSHGIYADRIWMLYKDVCKCSIPHVIAVFRAYQMGQLAGVTDEVIDSAIDGKIKLNLDDIMEAVQKELPNFNR